MLQAAIVDDEHLARSRLRRLLENVAGTKVRVVAECVDVDDLLQTVEDMRIDVLFLDIELPGGDGFSALSRWNGSMPLVVFVTAYEQHGVRAFDSRAIDYLLKPVSADRLRETVARLEGRVLPQRIRERQEVTRKLSLQVGRRKKVISEDSIQVIRSKGNYVDVETLEGTFTLRQPLAEFLGGLDPTRFMRVHRSAAVRSAAVVDVLSMGSGRYQITLDCGRTQTSGRLYREAVQELVKAGQEGCGGR